MATEASVTRAYLRVSDITRNRRTGKPGLLPITPSTWWSWVQSGKAPAPIRLSPGCTVWRESDVLAFVEAVGREAA